MQFQRGKTITLARKKNTKKIFLNLSVIYVWPFLHGWWEDPSIRNVKKKKQKNSDLQNYSVPGHKWKKLANSEQRRGLNHQTESRQKQVQKKIHSHEVQAAHLIVVVCDAGHKTPRSSKNTHLKIHAITHELKMVCMQMIPWETRIQRVKHSNPNYTCHRTRRCSKYSCNNFRSKRIRGWRAARRRLTQNCTGAHKTEKSVVSKRWRGLQHQCEV